MRIGFHTDAFNSAYWSFDRCVRWAHDHGIHYIECGAIDGVSWVHGLGYQPHVALWEDPILLRRKMEKLDVQFSQIDAAFPLSRPEGITLGVEYVLNVTRWAKLAGCPCVDTTDDRDKPAGLSDRDTLAQMRRIYQEIVKIAEIYDIVINVEPHGYYTTNPDAMDQILRFVDSPYLRLNMDTGNTLIAGQDPVGFLERFKHKVSHVHIKDVSEAFYSAMRGETTGIALSHCAIGEGVNAENIRRCLSILKTAGFNGVLSIECEANGGPILERSLAWLHKSLTAAAAA